MIIPITQRYNPALPSIGSVEPSERGLLVTLVRGTSLSREEIFQIFGCPGAQVLEAVGEGDEIRFTKFLITEFTRPACYEPVGIDEVIRRAHTEGRKAGFRECGFCPDCGEEIGDLCDCETPISDRPDSIKKDNLILLPPRPAPLRPSGPGRFDPEQLALEKKSPVFLAIVSIYIIAVLSAIAIPLALHFKGAM